MEMTSANFDSLRAVCGIKRIHQWRLVKYWMVKRSGIGDFGGG